LSGDGDDDLAGGSSLFDQQYGLCGFGERVGPVDDGGEVPGLDEFCDLVEGFSCLLGVEGLPGLADEEAEDRGFNDVGEGSNSAVAVPE
jgi:hypothetical protein